MVDWKDTLSIKDTYMHVQCTFKMLSLFKARSYSQWSCTEECQSIMIHVNRSHHAINDNYAYYSLGWLT